MSNLHIQRSVFALPLSMITHEYNPRSTENLGQMGYKILDLIKMALDPDTQEDFIKLIEKHEPRVVRLANDLRVKQLQPVTVVNNGTKQVGDETVTKYGLVAGGHRAVGKAYNYAKYGDKPTVEAIVTKGKATELFDLAVRENIQREDFKPLEEAEIYRLYRDERGMKLTEIARFLNQDYQHVRARYALNNLSDEDKERLRTGNLGLTYATQKAMGKAVRGNGANKTDRQRVKTLKQCQELFDNTPRNHKSRLETLAEVMNITVEEALEASDARISEANAVREEKQEEAKSALEKAKNALAKAKKRFHDAA